MKTQKLKFATVPRWLCYTIQVLGWAAVLVCCVIFYHVMIRELCRALLWGARQIGTI